MVRVQQATAGVLHDHLALFKVRRQGPAHPGLVCSSLLLVHSSWPATHGCEQKTAVFTSFFPAPCPTQIDLDVLGTANKVVQKQVKVRTWNH